MLKGLKYIFLGTILLITLVLIWQISSRPTQIVPLPYQLELELADEELKKASHAHILVIGDRMGKSLDPYLELINEGLRPLLRDPLRIYNWAEESEGLHRSLAKIKALPEMPPIVLYLGSGQEFEEQRFRLQDSAAITENFLRYEDDLLLSLILSYPPLSRLIYYPHKMLDLSERRPMPELESDEKKQRISTLTYQTYRYEFEELLRIIKDANSQLVISTHPINLDIAPKKTCDNAQTFTQQKEQEDIQALLEADKTKEAYARATPLVKNSVANALNYYLKGQSAKRLGRFSEAAAALQLAAVFDCSYWRSSAVFNNMLEQFSKREDLHFIHFDFLINQNFGRDELFLNELYPQNIYYQRFMDEFLKVIRQILKL